MRKKTRGVDSGAGNKSRKRRSPAAGLTDLDAQRADDVKGSASKEQLRAAQKALEAYKIAVNNNSAG